MRLKARQHGFQRVQHLALQLVVDPTPLATIRNQAGVFQHFEVKGQPGLGGIGRLREVADTPLAVPEQLYDPNPGGVGERMEQSSGVCCMLAYRGRTAHGPMIYQLILICQELSSSPAGRGSLMNSQDFDLVMVLVVAEQVVHQHLADWHDAEGREVRIGVLFQRLAAGGYARQESREQVSAS
jgi:hypothetical protein